MATLPQREEKEELTANNVSPEDTPPQSPAGEGPPVDLEKQSTKSSFSPAPDGGRDAWLCVLGGFCCLFCSFGWINCVGVFQDYYQSHQLREYSASTISWISSLEIFCMFFFGPIFGWTFDCYGPRWLLLIGSFLQVFGLMMTSLCTEYYQFILAQGFCSPIGASMIFYPAMSCIVSWFDKKKGAAFGAIAAGSSVAGVVLPIMTQHLNRSIGFGWSMRSVAFLMLALLIIANLTVKCRFPPRPRPFRLMDFLDPLKEATFVLFTFGAFAFFLGLFIPINYIIVEGLSHGMSPRIAQYLVSILNAVSFFGRVIPGILADKIGRFNMTIIMCTFTGVITLALWLPATSSAPIIVFAALYGFGSGAFVSLAPAVIGQISDPRKIGIRTGTMFAIVSIAALISNPIGGALIKEWNGKFTGLQIFAGVMLLGGAGIITAARITEGGAKPNKRV